MIAGRLSVVFGMPRVATFSGHDGMNEYVLKPKPYLLTAIVPSPNKSVTFPLVEFIFVVDFLNDKSQSF